MIFFHAHPRWRNRTAVSIARCDSLGVMHVMQREMRVPDRRGASRVAHGAWDLGPMVANKPVAERLSSMTMLTFETRRSRAMLLQLDLT